jgi:hypothetical protein
MESIKDEFYKEKGVSMLIRKTMERKGFSNRCMPPLRCLRPKVGGVCVEKYPLFDDE